MSNVNTTDNYDMWLLHEAEQQKQLERFPICDSCGERIQSEFRYRVAGVLLCEDCFEKFVNREIREENKENEI